MSSKCLINCFFGPNAFCHCSVIFLAFVVARASRLSSLSDVSVDWDLFHSLEPTNCFFGPKVFSLPLFCYSKFLGVCVVRASRASSLSDVLVDWDLFHSRAKAAEIVWTCRHQFGGLSQISAFVSHIYRWRLSFVGCMGRASELTISHIIRDGDGASVCRLIAYFLFGHVFRKAAEEANLKWTLYVLEMKSVLRRWHNIIASTSRKYCLKKKRKGVPSNCENRSNRQKCRQNAWLEPANCFFGPKAFCHCSVIFLAFALLAHLVCLRWATFRSIGIRFIRERRQQKSFGSEALRHQFGGLSQIVHLLATSIVGVYLLSGAREGRRSWQNRI